ncbi:MAG: sugar transporter [Rikenellaceae bacterium]
MTLSRTDKSLLNARVNAIYYFIILLISFFTRKIYIDSLGVEFMGLTTTLNSVLGFLNLTELGVGAAVSFTLYTPLARDDRVEINKIISILGYIYIRIGCIILGLGVLLSLFFVWMFESSGISLAVIYFAFYCYLLASLLGYFLNYPSTLFTADQRGYEITRYSQLAAVARMLLAAAIAKWSANLYLFVFVDLLFGAIVAYIIQRRVSRVYPWLKASLSHAREYLREYPSIITKTKQVFAHKIGGLVQSQATPIIIYSFTTLTVVALYTNYTVITAKLSGAVESVMGSSIASVGNLVAQGDTQRIVKVYYEMLSLRFFVAGYFTFMLYMLTEPFITIWLGGEFLLSHAVLVIMLFSCYISYFRNTTEQFIMGYGLFDDVWAPYTESAICIVASIVGGYYWGLAGILSGNALSLITIIGVWKPYFLYSRGFKRSVWGYWRGFALRFAIFMVASLLTILVYDRWLSIVATSYLQFIVCGLYLTLLFLAIYTPMLLIFDRGFREFTSRTIRICINFFHLIC